MTTTNNPNKAANGQSQHNAMITPNLVAKQDVLVSFVIALDPNETTFEQIKEKFIKTSENIHIKALTVFIGKKINVNPEKIDFSERPSGAPLPATMTVKQIRQIIHV